MWCSSTTRNTSGTGHCCAWRSGTRSWPWRNFGGYGVATWSGFTEGAFTVPELLGLAVEAAGSHEHHIGAVQLPVSLVMDHALGHALDGRGPLVRWTAENS